MALKTLSLAAIAREPFSTSGTAGDDFREESQKKEIVIRYLEGASEITHPSPKDRVYRLIEIARIVLHDFGLNWNDANDVVAAFNRSQVHPSIDDDWLKDIMNVAMNYRTDKQVGWRVYADPVHFEGEYDIHFQSFILNTQSPNKTARAFLRSHCSVRGMPKLRFFQGDYWEWEGSRYTRVEESKVRCRLEEFLEMAVVSSGENYVPFPTTPKVLNAVMESVQRNILLSNDIQLPYFLGGGKPREASDTLIFGRSKTLCLRDREVFDSEPCWFSTGNLDLDPDPDAPEPVEWNRFLDSVFGDDQMSKDLLHEYMGLVVSGETAFQKLLLLIGETRGGKGIVVGTMENLVGYGNYCALAVDQLGDKFGLGDLPGKKLIEMNEAYFGNKPSDRKVVERLLSIIGGDTVVTERKYKDSFSVRIDGLFVMSTNKLPDLTNVGSALSARLLPLVFDKSFADSQDVYLAEKFESELPGILNLALDGLERLRARGRFILPPSSEEMLSRIRKRFDPLSEFINEQCNRQGRCPVKRLLDAYNRWRGQQDLTPLTASVLGRELAHYPGIKVRQGKEGRFYEGVELK